MGTFKWLYASLRGMARSIRNTLISLLSRCDDDNDNKKDVAGLSSLPIVVTEWSDNNKGAAYVDLGLSVKWATFNVGATKPEECGRDYHLQEAEKYIDIGGNISGTQFDVARRCGGSWRMPTKTEFEELRQKCTWTWQTVTV